MEEIKPKHYQIEVKDRLSGDSINCDYFDIGNALNLPIEWFTALRYSRIKGDINKQINDTDKAIECLKAYRDRLSNGVKLF